MRRSGRTIWIVFLAFRAISAFAQTGDGAPVLERLSATAPDSNLITTITGAAGAVPPQSSVVCVNMETGHYEVTQAAPDGSFRQTIFSAAGAWILVKSDTTGTLLQWLAPRQSPVIDHNFHVLVSMPGTVVRVPASTPSSGLPFAASGVTSFLPLWTIEGTIDRAAYKPGDSIRIRGTYTLLGRSDGTGTPQLDLVAALVALTRPDGSGTLDQNSYASVFSTPTGLPIERSPGFSFRDPLRAPIPLQADGDRLRGTIDVSLPIPSDFAAGYYRPLLLLGNLRGITMSTPADIRITTFIDSAGRHPRNGAHLPIIRIGDPASPTFYWTLCANTTSGGMRGINALEDRGKFSISPRITTASEPFVVPRIDPRTGAILRYNIEPFALTVGLGDRGAPINPFMIPFRFPSGSLTATVRRPDGTSVTIGPSPFKQAVLRGLATPQHDLMENGGYINDAVQLSTLDPAFSIEFTQEGAHTISLSGTIHDVWGNVWSGRGTYVVTVARDLILDTALLPGTPLESGNTITPAVQLLPPLPATVEMRLRFARNSNEDAISDTTIHGAANRFGVFRADPVRIPDSGEYRIDVSAQYSDGSRLWSGSRTWGGVVAPQQSSIIAHGHRGIDSQTDGRQQWFSRRQLGVEVGRSHVPFPFQPGDVMWMEKRESDLPAISVQDMTGSVVSLMKTRCCPQSAGTPNGFDSSAQSGEMPLFSSTASGRDPHLDPSAVDLWAYSYRFVSRPLVRIREEIAEEGNPAPYWRFSDRYGGQRGSGANGDLPNDFKFQFGGAVLRGRALAQPLHAIYASLFVLVADNDPGGGTRTFPPFQGNGGGPSGGPLFKLKGKEIDLFFHPTAIRPGTILQIGETASFAGYSAPTLPSKIEIVVTSPSGVQRTIKGQANKIGYFYDPQQDFTVGEAGVWKARVKIVFDGVTSAGQVTPPYPTGDVLGSRDGEFYFYVVRGDAPPLDVRVAAAASAADRHDSAGEAPAAPQFLHPAAGPIPFTITPPSGLRDVQLSYTTMMPGFLLEEGTTGTLTYTYDAPKLAKDFPNLDLFDADGFAGVDTITMSFLVSGTDAGGQRKHFARQIVLQGEELQMPEQKPRVRRRTVQR